MIMANVKLSQAERELMINAQIILTKNNIIAKVYELFGRLSSHYTEQAQQHINVLAQEPLSIQPKISKGENYLGLPWVMLDYPRYFSGDDIFSVRTFFWWGNYCSISLLLSGKFQQQYAAAIETWISRNDTQHWFFCCNEDKWEHHFEEDNYQPISISGTKKIKELSFIKLAKKIPLQEWDETEIFLQNGFIEIMNILSGSAS